MATRQYAPTSETTNACRASRVLLGPCSDQLRDLLRHHVPPSTFSHVIHKQKRKLLKLTKPQLDLIYPQSGPYTGDYSDFDISLLYTLLRNLCNIPKHNKGWGNDPDPNDMSLSANIERIRICRNRLGHASDFSLPDLEFNDIWSSISTAVIEIDKVLKISHKYEKDLDYLKIATMDSGMAKYFEEILRKQYEEDLEIKSLLSEHIKCSDQHIKRSDEKLNDMKSLIVKEFECTKAMIRDQQRRNTSIGDTYTAQCNTNSEIQPAPRLPFRTVQITQSSITAEWGNCEKWLSDQQRHYILTCTKNSETHSEDSESKTEIIEVNQDVLPVQKCKGTVSELLSNTIYSLKVKAENGNVVSSELEMERQTKTKVDALIEPFLSSEDAGLYIRKTYENLITDVLDKIDTDMLAEYLLQMAIISKNSFDDIKGANLLKKNDLIVKNVLAKRNIAEYPHENFWEALEFYLPHTKRKLVENARKNEEQITKSLPFLSWEFIYDHRDELDVDDILNTAHALFAVGYIKASEHDDILLSKSPSKKVEALMNIVSEKQNKVLFLQAFEARCNRTQLEGLFERQKNSESATNSQTGAGLAQVILTGDKEILSQMFENKHFMKDLEDMIEKNGFKVKLSKQNSIVIELSSSSETSYTEFVKILNEGRIDDFIEYLLAKHNISKDSPEGNTKIKLRLSTLPPAEDQSKMKEKILRRSFPHVLHKCLPNSIMEEIKKLKLPTQFHMKLLEGLNKSDNDNNLKKTRFLMTMLLQEDTISEESTRCLMKNLVGSGILDYELKRNTDDIVGKIGEKYGHILRELHGNIIMKMNEIYAVFGDEVFRSDSKSKQDRSALFLEDVLTKESKVLDLANVLSMLELDSLLHDKESETGQVKCVQKKGQLCHVVYERQMEIPLADEESRAACKYSSMQETNAERASRILLGPCEDQLRDVLRHHVPPAIFHDAITRHRSNLLLTQSQTEIILPRTGRYSGDYSDMNISLLYSLLRNLCKFPSHRNGWGKTPDISDSSLSASIDRIRMARNAVVHCSRTILFQKEFNDLLIEIKMAVISIDSYLGNSKTYEKVVDSLLTETMNQEQDVFIQQLRKQVEEDETMLERINKTEKRIHEDISTVQKRARRKDTELWGLGRDVESLDFPIQEHEKEMRLQVLEKRSVQEQRDSMKKLLVQAQDVPCKTGRHLEEHVVIRYDTKLPENRIAHEVDDGIEIITKNPYYVSDETRSEKSSIPALDLLIIKDCIRTNADNLWKKHSNLTIITGDSIKSVNKKNLPKTCIVLYCLSKGFIPMKEEPFPKELSCTLGKFETDVREGYFTLGPTTKYGVLDAYNDPICMGSSIGSNWRNVSGSLGLFVDLPQNEMGFITCCHVLFDCIKPNVFHYQKEATSAPRYVVQPGNTSLCGREYDERECGEIVKAKFDPCSSQISVDVALVKISKRKPTTGHFVIKDTTQSKELGFPKDEFPVFDTGEVRKNVRPRDHDRPLLKSGTSTGLTRSLFRMDGAQVRIFQEGAWLRSKDGEEIIMKGQIEVEGGIMKKPFFIPGDSGSAVFIKDPNGQLACVGIAIGLTSYDTTVVTPIEAVLSALDLNDSDVTKFS